MSGSLVVHSHWESANFKLFYILQILAQFIVGKIDCADSFFLILPRSVAAEHFQFLTNSQLPARSDYELNVLILVLEETKEAYGDYTISLRESGYSITRLNKIAHEHQDVILWASPYHPLNNKIAVIKQPIFNGVFGLRKIIMRKELIAKIHELKTLDSLKHYTIGQGPGWSDVEVYKDAGFTVVEASLSKLFKMASAQRFDLLPLGFIEIDEQLLKQKQGAEGLSIAPNHMFYYPHPVLFHLSQKHSSVVTRLNLGMQQILANGKLTTLFNQHFGKIAQHISQNGIHVFRMMNNKLPIEYQELTEFTQIEQSITGN
ncbi:hypothetical protein RS130_02705 [Paraglaciecola aquimarina]|uniref:Solute-binding protein family 3/N-terminal domain-containing protein n=1 Tax=Paraglaciecola aquimarina TaxID=1235557 RepID=A0ABU3SSN1_9ALTE|nr:hypothetical protein [Paraglaciecola aquimarina]MDU0352983.1 hypothetical protein [Paraglaciecola aquimarina]